MKIKNWIESHYKPHMLKDLETGEEFEDYYLTDWKHDAAEFTSFALRIAIIAFIAHLTWQFYVTASITTTQTQWTLCDEQVDDIKWCIENINN